MNFRKNQAFWTSVILHLVVVFALLLGVIIEAFKPKEEELHVFQMMNQPSQNTNQRDAPPPVEPEQMEPAEMELPDMPELAEIPEPTPPEPTPPTPAPTKPAQMSYEDFLKQNPLKPKKQRPAPTPQSRLKIRINAPKINVPDIYIPSTSNQAMSSQEQDAMRRYVGQISAMLNRAWIKPGSLAGRDIKVVAIFYVDSSGRISNIRFQPGSGNAAFDTSVKAAFAKIGTAGPTPTGKGQEIRISFNMLD
ncbi:MAG: TonB family protein [Lentimonas sp.]